MSDDLLTRCRELVPKIRRGLYGDGPDLTLTFRITVCAEIIAAFVESERKASALAELENMPEFGWPNAAGYEEWRKQRIAELDQHDQVKRFPKGSDLPHPVSGASED